MLRSLKLIVIFIAALTFLGSVTAGATVYLIFKHYSEDLPDYVQLLEYNPPVVSRLYAADGQLIKEYSNEHRLYVPIAAIPPHVSNAFIAAEDKNFYSHPGVDVFGIMRAAIQNLQNIRTNKRLVGASTITQQVVKNFLLTNEQSLERKIKEAILAFRVTKVLSKDRILELYLNQIYLGNSSYGVASAAMNYFNKPLSELTIEEAAMLAALPKAPSQLNPYKNHDAALERRNWVIERMEEEDFISEQDLEVAQNTAIQLRPRSEAKITEVPYFTDAVRQQLVEDFGEKNLYEDGYSVYTTLDIELQALAQKALKENLIKYDRRNGFRKPLGMIDAIEISMDGGKSALSKFTLPAGVDKDWKIALIHSMDKEYLHLRLQDGSKGVIAQRHVRWARNWLPENQVEHARIRKIQKEIEESLGVSFYVELPGALRPVENTLTAGYVVLVKEVDIENGLEGIPSYGLRQVPKANGAVIAMDPHTGKILAMVGGFDYDISQFNRAVQAKRQPGSAFKPFVYLAALENGFTPASMIVDEKIEMEEEDDQPIWRPKNYSGEYFGPTTLRRGLEKSRNIVTIRLAVMMGIQHVMDIARKFGIAGANMQRNFASVLGASETSLIEITNAYSMIVNGGKRIKPALIERIQNRNGKTIFKRDGRNCLTCVLYSHYDSNQTLEAYKTLKERNLSEYTPPRLADMRESIIDTRSAYQIVSLLQGVVQRGTAISARGLGRTIAGKTGTTNNSNDTWFIGFSPDLVVGVYVGFDNPSPLGARETGSTVALPIFKDIMKEALADKPDIPFRVPRGLQLVKIDKETGLLPSDSTPEKDIITESFKVGNSPTVYSVRSYDEDMTLPWQTHNSGSHVQNELPQENYQPHLDPLMFSFPQEEIAPSGSTPLGTGGIY